MDDSPYGLYLLIIVLICFSAFFSGSEIAFASANKMRMKKAAESGNKKAKLAYYIYERYDKALTTILIGNNLVNMASSAIATVIAIKLMGESGAAIATVAMTVIILIFGEIIPKILAKDHCDAFTLTVAPFLRFLMLITAPLVFVVMKLLDVMNRTWANQKKEPSVTEEDLVSIIETVEDEGVIDEERSDLLQSAIEFSEISAQEIITPRVDMLAIDIDDDLDSIIELANHSRYSRIPVFEGSIDNIIGILYLNHFFKQVVDTKEFSLRDLLMDVCFIHKSMKLPAVLAELKRRKMHMAIVTDEYGGTLGVVTMEDVLEQLVGEIWDESDEIVQEFTDVGENIHEVDADISIYDFLEYFDLDDRDFESDYTTVGGWAIEMLNGFPNPGDSFTYKNLTVTVDKIQEHRIIQVLVKVDPPQKKREY
ncbi:MAG: hemolysin family protein [Negativicutes bacterium]|nr:hemolysin family protein [Negativicutes bacterium]